MAHIRADRSVKFYDEDIPNTIKAVIECVARNDVSLGERPAATKKPATLREKMDNARQKAKEYNAKRDGNRGTQPKKRGERE